MELRPPPAKPDQVNASTALARPLNCSSRPSGTEIPTHFLTDSAITPNGSAAVERAPAPKPLNVNALTPRASSVSCAPKPSGTSTSTHFLTDSARVPRGSATFEILKPPIMPSVLAILPKAISPRAAPIAARPFSISSHDIVPNCLSAFAISSSA